VAGANKAGTLIHELAHSLLHFKSSIFHLDDEKSDKQTKELQAEAVSFVVLRHYDIPAEHQSTYLALFKVNSEAVKGNLDVIKKASNFIIKEIDKVATAEEGSEVEVTL
jgi:Zn-dependent peptidase ImmA (M78 family)